MKNVLVIGGGGREHAIVDALSRSSRVGTIYAAPGNAGIGKQAVCLPFKDTDVDGLLAFAKEKAIDLTIVGPEATLATGLVDQFRKEGLSVFGHTKAATRIESSKEFAKQIMAQYHIPTASYHTFTCYEEAVSFVHTHGVPTVIKYDGLAAGKGVVVAMSMDEAEHALKDMLLDEQFGEGKVLIEEYLEGPEFSFMCFVHGEHVYPMPLAQDHKRALDGDKGPNTGGMGAYSPLPFITEEDKAYAFTNILQATAHAMVQEGCPLSGVLYGGLMKTPNGIKVIEFNARFGDPETEVVLPLLETDAYDVFHAIANGESMNSIQWKNEAIMGVVLASVGYPGHYDKGAVIEGVDQTDTLIYHMGTKEEDGLLKTNGGRVMMCIATGHNLQEAHDKVYKELSNIKCDNLRYRYDIGHYGLAF